MVGAAEAAQHVYSHPHRFERYSYTTPTYCDLCSNVLWGPVKVGTVVMIMKYRTSLQDPMHCRSSAKIFGNPYSEVNILEQIRKCLRSITLVVHFLYNCS